MVVLVAPDWLPGRAVRVGEPIQVRVDQDPVVCRRGGPQPVDQLRRSLAQTQT